MSGAKTPPPDLELMRFELDVVDDNIVDMLAGRFRRLERVAQIKAREDLPGHDPHRERAILERLEKRLAHLDVETRHDVMEVARAMLERGRAHVKRRTRELRARHDRRDGSEVAMEPGGRSGAGGGGTSGG